MSEMWPAIFVPDLWAEVSERKGSGAVGKKCCRKREGLLLGMQKKLPHSSWGCHAEAAEELGHAVDHLAKGGEITA